MRVGNSQSVSYRKVRARQWRRKQVEIAKLCTRLDKLVVRAETFRTGKTRQSLFMQADKVREKLRVLDH